MEEDIEIIKKHYVFTTNHVLDDQNKQFKQAVENLINKYKEQQQVIELMAKDITENKLDEDICRQVKDPKKEECYAYMHDENACSDCVIEFYKKKARTSNDKQRMVIK